MAAINPVAQIRHDYEARIRVLERSLSGEKERGRQCGFLNRQLETQLKKAQQEIFALSKALKEVKKCASCSCSEERRRQEGATDGLLYGLLPRSRSTLSVAGTASAPLDPEQPSRSGASARELHTLRDANLSLQQCVDSLQKLMKDKAKEAALREQQFAETLQQRDEQIRQLSDELQRRQRVRSSRASQEEGPSVSRIALLITERNQLLSRIRLLEEQLARFRVDASRPQTSSNRYCVSCSQRATEWNRVANDVGGGVSADRSVASQTSSSSCDPSALDQLRRERNGLRENLKKLKDDIEAERLRYAANESLMKNQIELVSSDYDRVLRRCEALEVELAKRRGEDLQKRAATGAKEKLFIADPTAERDAATDSNVTDLLKTELREAHGKIADLQAELTNTRRAGATESEIVETLRRDIDDLEIYKRDCKRRLLEQEQTLQQLEEDIACLMDEKHYFAHKCGELQQTNERTLKDNIGHLDTIHKLRVDLSEAERLRSESAREHIAQIEAYQELLRQKDAERALFIQQLCNDDEVQTALHDGTPPIPSEKKSAVDRQRYDEAKKKVDSLSDTIHKLTAETERLQKALQLAEERLREKERDIEQEIALKNSFHDDLANARKLLIDKDAELLECTSRLRALEANVPKLETELAAALERADVERTSADASKAMADDLEEVVREKSDQLVAATIELQRAASDAARLRENIYDLESKLALQGRDLKNTRSRLADLKAKIRELERQTRQTPTRSNSQTTQQSPLTVSASPSPPLQLS